jgi:hypothetical protein
MHRQIIQGQASMPSNLMIAMALLEREIPDFTR